MEWRNLPARMEQYLRQAEASPTMARTLTTMDSGIRFMTQKNYAPANSAIVVVRAPLVAGLWIMLALAFVVLIWGMLAPIESAAVAKGTVTLLSNKKTIQHLEGGVIEAILVKDGDKVAAGQKLVRLNDTAAKANRDLLQGQLYVARAALARLSAARDQKTHIDFDKDMEEGGKSNEELAKVMAAQMRLFAAEQEAQRAKVAALGQRIAQSREQIEGLKSQISGASGQVSLLAEEIDTVQALLAKGYATKTRLFELQRNQSELQGNKGQYGAEIVKAQQSIAETEMEILTQQKEFETKNSQELRDAQAQAADLQEKLRAAQDVASRTVIAAPVGGVVTGLKYHTAGGVIAPGAAVMDIVPQDDQLVIEAHVKPNDISIVHAGLEARVIFTAYKMRTTPKVPGKITYVSADTVTEERSAAPASYYIARVEVDKQFLQRLNKPVELYPGMPAEVLIRTGSRSFLSYLFKPITDSMHGAFREE